jgi:hypothetical protein
MAISTVPALAYHLAECHDILVGPDQKLRLKGHKYLAAHCQYTSASYDILRRHVNIHKNILFGRSRGSRSQNIRFNIIVVDLALVEFTWLA